ncbi:hypothetical protein M422DRAFT_68479, partial [Sphaerobolus stellatus SS14]
MARYPRSDRIHNNYHSYAPRSERSMEGLVYQIAAITCESMPEGLCLGARNTSPYPPHGQRPRGTFFNNRGRGRFSKDRSNYRSMSPVSQMPCAVEKLVKTKLSELFLWKGKDNEEVRRNPSPEHISMEPEAASRSVEQTVTTGIINPQELQ